MKFIFYLSFTILLSNFVAAQVGIGTTNPHDSAILHLDVNSLPSNGKKGLLPPSVNLLNDSDVVTIPSPAEGLLIYNNGTVLSKGYYYWNGTEWRNIENSTAIPPAITSLECSAASLDPSIYIAGVPYIGNLKIPYKGGNGGSYRAGSTITVNGISFTLRTSKLEFGDGELIFSVSATSPTISSPNSTTVAIQGATGNNIIPFLTAAMHCSVTVGDNLLAKVKTNATVGPLFATSDPSPGYHRFVTSPDGKYSVRVVIESGSAFGLSDLQIRSNVGTPSILWLGNVLYVNSVISHGNNGMAFPAQNVWYGNGGGSGTIMGNGITNAWGDPDVYYFNPEIRTYLWSSTDSSDPTFYKLEFMLGAPNSYLVADTFNCPSGTCTNTKAYLSITQTRGD